MDKKLEEHVKDIVEEHIDEQYGDTDVGQATKAEAGLTSDDDGKTKTTVTVELEFEGFVGVRQAELGAAAMLSNVKNATTFDGARVVKVETEFGQGGKKFKGLASGAELAKMMRQEREAAPAMFGREPAPSLSGHTVAPLGVEEERGGLESGNVEELGGKVGAYGIGDKVKPAKGVGEKVTGTNSDATATPGRSGSGGQPTSQAGSKGSGGNKTGGQPTAKASGSKTETARKTGSK